MIFNVVFVSHVGSNVVQRVFHINKNTNNESIHCILYKISLTILMLNINIFPIVRVNLTVVVSIC